MASIDSLANRRTPERRTPLMGGPVVERLTPATIAFSGATTLTAAQLLKKLIPLNCSSGATLTLPTADLIVAAMPGIGVGDVLEVQFINPGSSTATLAEGTGITNKVIDSEDAILTIATHQSLRIALVCTAIANPSDPSTSNTFDLYGYGQVTATS
jgi:hypothetical protein